MSYYPNQQLEVTMPVKDWQMLATLARAGHRSYEQMVSQAIEQQMPDIHISALHDVNLEAYRLITNIDNALYAAGVKI